MQANPPSRFVKAILTGVILTITTAVVLSPIVVVVFMSLFELYVFSTPPPGAWINDAIILITFFGALFTAAGVSGWACTARRGMVMPTRMRFFFPFFGYVSLHF